MVLATHFELGVIRDGGTRLVDAPLAREHLAGQDQRLRAGARLSQSAIDQKLVRALLHPSPRHCEARGAQAISLPWCVGTDHAGDCFGAPRLAMT